MLVNTSRWIHDKKIHKHATMFPAQQHCDIDEKHAIFGSILLYHTTEKRAPASDWWICGQLMKLDYMETGGHNVNDNNNDDDG